MDSKITLSFDKETIILAKRFADARNLSLSRLTEYLYRKITSEHFQNLEDLPIAEWVNQVAEGRAEYRTKPRSRKLMKKEYLASKK